jgi:bacterial/archaeal transporter family-2 protein
VGSNAELNKQLASPLWAGVVVYGTGLVALLLLELIFRQHSPAHLRLSSIPSWAWFGGIISVVPALAGITLAKRLGAGTFTGLSITAAMACSLVLDHFALVGFPQHTASPARIGGSCLMIAGLWIVTRT